MPRPQSPAPWHRPASPRAGVVIRRHPRIHFREPTWRGALLILLAVALTGAVLALGAGIAAGYGIYTRTLAEFASPRASIAAIADSGGAQIYAGDGTLLYRFADPNGSIRIPARIDQINPLMVNATVSTEDASFWSGRGLDISGTLGAAWTNLRHYGNPLAGRGGSGITQQLVKETLIPAGERDQHSVGRKLQEAMISVALTGSTPKSDILDWYLNLVNYGGVYDGVESAAEGYFGIHAAQLDLAQSAMLAGIPQFPTQNSPYVDWNAAKQRQGEVLDLEVKHGYISQEEADRARQEKLTILPVQQSLPLKAPWFVEYVKQQLIARYGEHCFDTCGLVVSTTLDPDLQDAAQRILNDNLDKWGEPVGVHDGALLSIDARTGEILVMLGNRNYDDESPSVQGKNNFTTAVLQPGSSFKPIVYTSLFMNRGYGPDSIIWDAPFSTSDGYQCQDPVKGGVTQGPIPVRLALGSSLNCAANRAAEVTGIPNIIQTAHKLGITTMPDASGYGASIATGGANITMLDMAYAYTTLARDGNMIGDTPVEHYPAGYRPLDPVAISQIKNGRGDVIYHYQAKTQQVIPTAFPYLVTSIISDCQNRRLIWQCGFPEFVLADGRPVAAKTGTQQGADLGHTIANWQFMYTPQIVTAGWVGNADRTPWTDVNGGANAVGYSVDQLENAIIQADQIPPQNFSRPSDVVSALVHVPDGSRDLLFGCGPVEQGLFSQGTAPDINNRICRNGSIVIPQDQLGTGGLGAFSTPRQQQQLPFVPGFPYAPALPAQPAQPNPSYAPEPARPNPSYAPPPRPRQPPPARGGRRRG